MEYREPSTALALGAISGGGGYLYTGDTSKGIGGIAALVGALALTPVIPFGLGLVPLLVIASWGALGAYGQAKAVNRFLHSRQLADAAQSGRPAAHQLLASMPDRGQRSAAPGGPQLPSVPAPGELDGHAALITRLHKLASIRASGVIDDNEYRARKIDVLGDAATGLDAGNTESLLFALLPLLDAGALVEEDLQFVKDLGT
jgi:hypothetical protein